MVNLIDQDRANLAGEWKDRSINTSDTIAAQDVRYVKDFAQYSVSNPHPEYGKDKNLINEFGHTVYPKMIYPNGKDAPYVIANSAEHEAELMGTKPADELSDEGPTIQQFVAAGYPAKDYPPKGYKSKSTEEEIKEAIDAEASKTNSNGWG